MRFLPIAFLSSTLAVLTAFACGGSTDNGTGTPGASDSGTAADTGTPMNADSGSPQGSMDSASPEDSGTATDATDSSAPYPAFKPTDVPQVVDLGGPVMPTPKIVPVFFADDDAMTTASLADFVSKVGQTQYWKAFTTEYGVGAATGLPTIELTAADNPPSTLDDSAIEPWLASKLNANDPAWGTPDTNTIYALFYPAGVTITLGGGGTPDAGADAGFGGAATSCVDFGGYHQNIQLDMNHQFMNVAYAVIPRCATFGKLTGLDVLTGAGSHEFAEAVTDPFPTSTSVNPAYGQVDDAHLYWEFFLGGGEIGDMCAQNSSSFTKFPELPSYTVQRSWSNMAAMAGLDPCVPPVASEVYFNSLPVLNDTLMLNIGGQTVTAKGVHIPAGQSATVELDLFSLAPTSGPWTLSALDGAAIRGQTPQLQFAFDKPSGQNGDKINMTITVVTASRRNRETFAVISDLNGRKEFWLGIVGN